MSETGSARYESTAAFHELMAVVKDADRLFLEGPRAVGDEVSVAEGYRWLTEILHVALDCYVWADVARPHFVSIVGPTKKFGGDNSDAFYQFAALDPGRDYLVRGTRGDAAYLSLTVYGGPQDGRWSTRIIGTLNDREMKLDADGTFEVVLSARQHPGNWIRLEPDTECVVTRDYLIEPTREREAQWSIESLDLAPPPRLGDAELARRFRFTGNFLRDLLNVFPIAYDEAKRNTIDPPFPVPKVTYGWAAGDAAYAMGAYDLEPGQALLLEGTSPPCAFWNVCLWNPFLQTYDYRYERVTINGGQVRYEADGSWRIVISAEDPSHPNWISTAGHRRGRVWFRWFLPEEAPERPAARVVPVDQLR